MRAEFRKDAIGYEHRQQQLGRYSPPWWIALLTLLLTACVGSDDSSSQDAVLIRCDQRTITRSQFERAFEAARIAYSDDRTADPQAIADARLRLLNQMAEEVIVDRRAQDLGVALDERDVETAIAAIKADYPPQEFEQMLLESAISYSLWKDRLRARLLMQKVVDHDLMQTQEITTPEIQAYFKAHESEFAVDEKTAPQPDLTRRIVDRLRREKVEARYPQWMTRLREQYQLSINWALWEQLHPADKESNDRKKEPSP